MAHYIVKGADIERENTMAKTLFDKLYDVTEDDVKAEKKPLIQAKILRALDGARDSYEDQKIDTQNEINELTRALVQGEIDAIQDLVDLKTTLLEVQMQLAAVVELKAELTAVVEK
jgi:hypothetical protein